jgi:hypothetical protein
MQKTIRFMSYAHSLPQPLSRNKLKIPSLLWEYGQEAPAVELHYRLTTDQR